MGGLIVRRVVLRVGFVKRAGLLWDGRGRVFGVIAWRVEGGKEKG
jgi:hypothetical protein